MNLIVAPTGFVRGASVGSLFGRVENEIRSGVTKTVADSFKSHPVRHLTNAAITERLDYCIAKAAELYRSLKWSSDRIVDELPAILKAKLDGTNWSPSTRGSWASRETQ